MAARAKPGLPGDEGPGDKPQTDQLRCLEQVLVPEEGSILWDLACLSTHLPACLMASRPDPYAITWSG